MLLPPSAVTLLRIRSLTYESVNFSRGRLANGFVRSCTPISSSAVGENKSASPVCRPTIVRKISDTELELSLPVERAPAKCFLSVSNQAGERKRWTTVTLHRSIRAGESVGSWVAIRTRVAKWRC